MTNTPKNPLDTVNQKISDIVESLDILQNRQEIKSLIENTISWNIELEECIKEFMNSWVWDAQVLNGYEGCEWYLEALLLTIFHFESLEEAQAQFSKFQFPVKISQFFSQFWGLESFFKKFPNIKKEVVSELQAIYRRKVENWELSDNDIDKKIEDYLNTKMEWAYVTFLLEANNLPADLWINLWNIAYKKIREQIYWK